MDSDVTEAASFLRNQRSPTTDQELVQQTKQQFGKPIALTVALVAISAITIAIATFFLWNLPFGNGTLQIVLSGFLGAFLALPILLSIWTVLGSQTWIVRIPLALTTELFLFCVYLGTISNVPPAPPTEVYWIFTGVALSVTLAAHIPLWFLRIYLNVQMGRHSTNHSAGESQFSIAHLLIATTIVAIAIPIAQWLISLDIANPNSGLPFGVIAGFCGIFILVISLLAMLSVIIVISPKLRIWCIGILLMAVVLVPIAVASTLPAVIGRPFTSTECIEVGLNVATFSVSHSTTLILILSLYDVLGFRIRRKIRHDG